ncbi:unnamed protein product [Brachionus calyciflorus]|uniref:Myosin motor domain-containing protein n=1 Tax=Brachionus calyciflorus TaxID=104777 RepID=A0A813MRC1_9BILA|nr:unnamed protein product [Brachionus calyciflorus]
MILSIATDKPSISSCSSPEQNKTNKKRFITKTTIAKNILNQNNKNLNNNNNNLNIVKDKINRQNLIANIHHEKNLFTKTISFNYQHDLNDEILNSSECSKISENLSDLSKIDIKTILDILYTKFKKTKYYTEASINTLIAMNPFRDHPELYSEKIMDFYTNSKNDLDPDSTPAHIYKHAATAWQIITKQNIKQLKKFELKNQTILVSGDSGSGKTRSINFIIQYYSYITPVTLRSIQIKNILLNTNQILESFGNARTLLNDNSSRFGKYIKLFFNSNRHELVSAKLITYLLEKTRSVNTRLEDNIENFNFHIFYQLLFGSSESDRAKYYLDRKLLKKYSSEGDLQLEYFYKQKFNQLKQSFQLIDLNLEEIFPLISGIAHLNCCLFEDLSEFKITTETKDHLINASRLFQFDLNDLNNYLLIHELRITNCKNDLIKKPCNLNQIKMRKNCLIKLIYNELFKYLVKSINKKLDFRPESNENNYIGLLDIYGFESIHGANSLEQLCINYANEKLQKIFVDSYFKLNKFEYEMEFPEEIFQIDYNDNLPLLNLIESSKNSLFCLLNEQSILKSHDHSINENQILLKLNQIFAKSDLIYEPRINCKNEFFIRHYAGVVVYKADSLITKNTDHIPDDLIKFLSKSKNDFLRDHVLGDYVRKVSCSSHKKLTVLSKFKKNLDTLILDLTKTNILYVRCIKPNYDLKSDYFNFELVKNQLESCGIISLLNLSKRGFIHKFLYQHFAYKFFSMIFLAYKKDKEITKSARLMLKQSNFKNICSMILSLVDRGDREYKIGVNKIFLKENLLKILENNLETSQNRAAALIQAKWKGHRDRKMYLYTLNSIFKIQTWWKKQVIKCRKNTELKSINSYMDNITTSSQRSSKSYTSSLCLINSTCESISFDDLSSINSSNFRIELDVTERKLIFEKQ